MAQEKNPIEYLKNGRIVEMRDGSKYMYLENVDDAFGRVFIGRNQSDGWENIASYDENLMHVSNNPSMRDFDIIAIYRLQNPNNILQFFNNMSFGAYTTVWKRENDDNLVIGIAAVKFVRPISERAKDNVYLFEIPYGERFTWPDMFAPDRHVLVNTRYGLAEAIVQSTHFFDSKSKTLEFMKKYPNAKLPLKKVIATISPTEW